MIRSGFGAALLRTTGANLVGGLGSRKESCRGGFCTVISRETPGGLLRGVYQRLVVRERDCSGYPGALQSAEPWRMVRLLSLLSSRRPVAVRVVQGQFLSRSGPCGSVGPVVCCWGPRSGAVGTARLGPRRGGGWQGERCRSPSSRQAPVEHEEAHGTVEALGSGSTPVHRIGVGPPREEP